MDADRWQEIEVLFEQALALPLEERAAYLAAACDNVELRQEVASLLDASERVGAVDRLAAELAAPLAAAREATGPPPLVPDVGHRIGPYRIVREIGRGGMGVVYLAERADEHFEQTVALKLVRDGLQSKHLQRRFLAERRVLARLQHPSIAQLLDGGVSEDEHPYFAMEYVEGEPLDRYCDARRLSVEERLQLFIQVGNAVHHAHQHLIVHRDVKPSNIFVTENGAAHVKLLDFGIAKILEESEDEPLTRPTARLLTPEYAAPEHIRGEPITTAADIYSLGVVLYELLSGRRPYDVRNLSPGQLEQVICTTEPPRPSTAVTRADTTEADSPTAEAIGEARAIAPDRLARRLAGDLDTIVLKALEKEPARRYASAEAFVEDIRRHLEGLPVEARPATLGYRVRRFVDRHRVSVAAATLAVLSLVGGLVGVAWQANIVASERDRAQAEAVKAEEALDFLVTLFESSDPNEVQGDSVTAREVLARGAQRLGELAEPDVKATLSESVGRVYQSLGLFGGADSLLVDALEIRQASAETAPRDLATSFYRLGSLRNERGDYASADTLLREALRLFGPEADSVEIARAESVLGYALSEQGRYDEAEPLLRRALAVHQARYSPSHIERQTTMKSLFELLHRKGDFAAAETLYREAVEQSRATPDRFDLTTADHYLGLARMLFHFRRDAAAAEEVLNECLPLVLDRYGPDHPIVATFHDDLARVLSAQGKLVEAEYHARAALAAWGQQFGDGHHDTASAKTTLSEVLLKQGTLDEAETLQREVLASHRNRYSPDHMAVISAQVRLAQTLGRRGKLAEAETMVLRVREDIERTSDASHPLWPRILHELGTIYHRQGRLGQSRDVFQQALNEREERHAPGHWRIAEAQILLAGPLIDLGDHARADSLVDIGTPVLEENLGSDAPATQRAIRYRAALDSASRG